MPQDARVYRKTFPRQTARYISWELNLAHPPPDQRIDYEIEAVYHRPDGTIFAHQTAGSHVDTGWRISWRTRGRGWSDPGNWKVGTYRVDLTVDGDLIASSPFEIVDRPILTTDSFNYLRGRLPWASDPLPSNKVRDLVALSSLMERDSGHASSVASLPWVYEGPIGASRGALELLDVLSEVDIGLAKRLTGVSWLSDDVTSDEQRALKSITLLAELDVSLAESLAALAWLQDNVTKDERSAARGLYQIGRQDAARLEVLLDSQWVSDDLTEDEKWAVLYIRDIGREEPALAERLIAFAWLADDLTEEEKWTVRYIRDMSREDSSIAHKLLGFSWLAGHVSENERWAVHYVSDISQEDTGIANLLLGLPWLGDEVSRDEQWGLKYLRDVAQEDLRLANRLAGSPFLQKPFRSRDRFAIQSLQFLRKKYPALYTEMVEQDWFMDGLSDDEAALVTVFGRDSGFMTPMDLRTFLTASRLESHPVMFPLRGEVMATDIQATRGRPRRDISSVVEAAALEIESFMGIPFPQDDLILLFAGCEGLAYSQECGFWGLYRGSHMVVDPRLAIKDARGTLIHEVAHYYWNSGGRVPLWFYEGGADFLDSYVQDSTIWRDLGIPEAAGSRSSRLLCAERHGVFAGRNRQTR